MRKWFTPTVFHHAGQGANLGGGVREASQGGCARSSLLLLSHGVRRLRGCRGQWECSEGLQGARRGRSVATACDVNHDTRVCEEVASKNHRHGKNWEMRKALTAHAIVPVHNQLRRAVRGSHTACEVEGGAACSNANSTSVQMIHNLFAEQ